MRRLLATLSVLALALAAPANAQDVPLSPFDDENVATTDDVRAMLANPAALGLRYSSELRFGWGQGGADDDWSQLLGSAGGVGIFGLRAPGERHVFGFTFATGSEDLRLGWTPYWLETPGGPAAFDNRLGLLSRPTPWLSLGATADHLAEPHFGGERLSRTWTMGLGLRPLAFDRARAHDLGTRFTLAAQVAIEEDAGAEAARTRVSAELEPVRGLVLHAAFARDREIRLAVTLRGLNSSLHGGTARAGDVRLHDHYAVSVHAGEERTAFVSRADRRIAVVRAGGLLADERLGGASLFGSSGTVSSAPLHRQLVRALEDPLVKGVLLDLRGVAGMAQLEELRPRVQELRLAGKPVVAFMELGGGRGDLYLASACDRVFATDAASFRGLGLRAERRYYRKFLEGLGFRLDRASIGAYKSAYRNYTVDSTSGPDAEVIDRTLDQSQALFVEALAQGRDVPAERFAHVLDGRAWSSSDLMAAGLLDSVGYRENALATLGRLAGLGARPRAVRLEDATTARREWTRRSPVAVVYASGAIETGRSANDVLMGPYMGSETMVAQLERAFRTPHVKVVVLRIESPGGEVIASNLIDHAVERLKRETGKPCIVSMGSVAASGGYDIALHADHIFANRHTRTGSIGVLFVKPSFEGFYAKHGIRQDTFERGAYMSGNSSARDWTPEFQASADSAVGRLYDSFVRNVAEGRAMSPESVHAVAQGRVWLGDDAVAHGLVDEIGGLDAALAEARTRAGVPPGENIRLLELRRPRGTFLERMVRNWVAQALESEASIRSFERPQFRDLEWLEAAGE